VAHPSRPAEAGGHLTGERTAFVPGMTTVWQLAQTYSNGSSIVLRFSSHSGTGKFFERMNAGLNSFD
jgi:hypothetical protein